MFQTPWIVAAQQVQLPLFVPSDWAAPVPTDICDVESVVSAVSKSGTPAAAIYQQSLTNLASAEVSRLEATTTRECSVGIHLRRLSVPDLCPEGSLWEIRLCALALSLQLGPSQPIQYPDSHDRCPRHWRTNHSDPPRFGRPRHACPRTHGSAHDVADLGYHVGGQPRASNQATRKSSPLSMPLHHPITSDMCLVHSSSMGIAKWWSIPSPATNRGRRSWTLNPPHGGRSMMTTISSNSKTPTH
jgi:hypothetical protein